MPVDNAAVAFATGVSAVPAFCMLVGSLLLMRMEVSARTQAVFQNLSAGIILAAVASELFPLLGAAHGVGGPIGLTVGFLAGLCTVFGVERAVGYFEGLEEDKDDEDNKHGGKWVEDATRRSSALLTEQHKDHIKARPLPGWAGAPQPPLATRAPSSSPPAQGHLDELAEAIALVDERSSKLLNPGLGAAEEEQVNEEIDEELHRLMYKLDHTRRLLEGAETGTPRTLPAGEKEALRGRVAELKVAVAHLQEHMTAPGEIDHPTVVEMHEHMDELEALLDGLHKVSAESFSYWRRRGPTSPPAAGALLPWSLIFPVTIDAFVDGFLIGIACSLSRHAGLVLAFASCIEMGFLGAAFAATITRCTGASLTRRLAVIVLPCLVIIASASVGGSLGDVSRQNPNVFVAFVAFGVVALLFLVTQELLIEAHEALKGDEVWWINVQLFTGIFIVLQVTHALPA